MGFKLILENQWHYHLIFCMILIFFQVPLYLLLLTVSSSYLYFGGWKSVKIFYKTFGRNSRYIFALMKVMWKLRSVDRSGDLIPDLFEKVSRSRPDKTAFLFEDESWTFQEVERYMNRVANLMRQLNLKPGSVVAVFCYSRPQYVALWLGVVRAGLVPALINFNLRGKSLANCLKSTKAKVLVFDDELESAVVEIEEAISRCRSKFSLGPGETSKVPGAVNLEAKIADCSSDWSGNRSERKLSDVLMYIFTSGTTGLPKPAVVAHSKFYLAAIVPKTVFNLTPDDVFYTALPLYHSAGGMMAVGQALINGTSVAIRKKFSATAFWTDCVRYNVTVVQYIGEICRYLLSRPESEADKRHSVRLAIGNGLRPALWSKFQTRFGIPQIAEFYGATESNANLINTDNTPGAVGFILPIIPTRLVRVDLESGKLIRDPKSGLCVPCRPGEPGQLIGKIIRNNAIRDFRGYLNNADNEKKIAKDVFANGDSYFLTGDILVMDELGYVYFQDRTGETFRWQGENVSTVEVESIITEALNLSSCAVYGVQIPGTEGRAGMVTIEEDETPIDLDALQNEVEKRLPLYARPLFIRITSGIDTTGTFKIKKTELMKTGFDISRITDRIFYRDSVSKRYLPLTETVYEDIMAGNVRF